MLAAAADHGRRRRRSTRGRRPGHALPGVEARPPRRPPKDIRDDTQVSGRVVLLPRWKPTVGYVAGVGGGITSSPSGNLLSCDAGCSWSWTPMPTKHKGTTSWTHPTSSRS